MGRPANRRGPSSTAPPTGLHPPETALPTDPPATGNRFCTGSCRPPCGIRMRVHDRRRLAQSRSAKQKSERNALR